MMMNRTINFEKWYYRKTLRGAHAPYHTEGKRQHTQKKNTDAYSNGTQKCAVFMKEPHYTTHRANDFIVTFLFRVF